VAAAPFLPYGRHSLDEADIQAVVAVLRGDWLTTGPVLGAFEDAFAAAVGAAHAVACSSGTAALHLAALALGLGPGDRAVVPAQTFLATANAVRLTGAEVVFADVDPDTGLLRPEDLERALAGGPVQAVLPVHLNGACADLPALAERAGRAGARLLEDAAHALGAGYAGAAGPVPVGSCRHAALTTFSLHPVKLLTMGEGGVVTCADPALAAHLRCLRNHGLTRDPAAFQYPGQAFGSDGEPLPWYYEMQALGLNYRASDLHCALGLSQLRRLETFRARRAALRERYRITLAGRLPAVRLVTAPPGQCPAWHLCPVLVDFQALGVPRERVVRALARQGIGVQVHYLPLHWQPYYRRRYGTLSLPGAEAYYRRVLSLPLFPAMTDGDVERVVTALGAALG
jgi:UDP-4-amino-4,6-dideoxy-N-acetyl-beta-L-altrosamine transaminase